MNNFWSQYLKEEAAKKSTLKYWNFHSIKYNECNPVWLNAGSDTVSVHKANIQIKFVCFVYMLQSTKAKFNQHGITSLCLLCQSEDENIIHFILTCKELQTVRGPFVCKLRNLLLLDSRISLWDTYMLEEKLQLILDNSVLDGLSDRVREEICDISRGMIYPEE